MKTLNKRLFRMIKTTKGQYIAVLSIVITGIFIFTAVKNSALNLQDTLYDYYYESNFADIFVSAMGVPKKVENSLEGRSGINQVEVRTVFDTTFISQDEYEKINVRVISANKSENKINKIYMRKGKRTLSENDVIVIDQFAKARNISIGDSITVQINGKRYNFNVSGIAASPEYVYIMENEQTLLPSPEKFGVIYIEEDHLQKLIGTTGNFNEITATVDPGSDLDKVKEFLNEYLDKYGVKRVTKKDEQLSNSMLTEEISGLNKMSQSLPIVFLCFAAVMLISMLSQIVKKDRTAIGVMKALGYTDWEVINHYLKYAASIGILGGLIGSVMGTVLSGFMTNLYLEFFNIPMLTVKIYYSRILVSVALSCLFCIVSGFWGLRDIMKINPAESMKAEAPKQGKRILIENIKFIWNRASFSWKIVLRNIFREKKKFLFIGAAIAITCSMMIMTFWMKDIMDVMFNRHYTEFMKMEYNISFGNFQKDNVKIELEKYIEYDGMEGRVEFPFELEKGRQSKIVNIIGLSNNTKFYDFKDVKGSEVKLPSEGILISSNLAKFLNVKIGDKVMMKNFIPDTDDKYVTVSGIIKQSLGINGYMNIDYLNDNFLDKDTINGVYLNSDDSVSAKLNDIRNISSVQSQDDMMGAFQEFTGLINAAIGMFIIFSGLLGFIIVYSMTLMNINERTLEFSSLRVMGFTKKEIFYMLIKENTVMSIVGIVIGIPLGSWLTSYVGESFSTDIYTMSEPLTANGIVLSVVLTIVFLILAQLMTYVKIHKLDFMQALKSRIT